MLRITVDGFKVETEMDFVGASDGLWPAVLELISISHCQPQLINCCQPTARCHMIVAVGCCHL